MMFARRYHQTWNIFFFLRWLAEPCAVRYDACIFMISQQHHGVNDGLRLRIIPKWPYFLYRYYRYYRYVLRIHIYIYIYMYIYIHILISRSILDGYFNPLVFWYQWELSTHQLRFCSFCRVSKIGNDIRGESLGFMSLNHGWWISPFNLEQHNFRKTNIADIPMQKATCKSMSYVRRAPQT